MSRKTRRHAGRRRAIERAMKEKAENEKVDWLVVCTDIDDPWEDSRVGKNSEARKNVGIHLPIVLVGLCFDYLANEDFEYTAYDPEVYKNFRNNTRARRNGSLCGKHGRGSYLFVDLDVQERKRWHEYRQRFREVRELSCSTQQKRKTRSTLRDDFYTWLHWRRGVSRWNRDEFIRLMTTRQRGW